MRVVDALRARITDAQVLAWRPYIGSVDQFADSVDVLSYPEVLPALSGVYDVK